MFDERVPQELLGDITVQINEWEKKLREVVQRLVPDYQETLIREPLEQMWNMTTNQWESFGFEVFECNGHHIEELKVYTFPYTTLFV